MLGFLIKIVVFAGIFAAIFGVIFLRRGSVPNPTQIIADVKHGIATADVTSIVKNLGTSLDALVTHPDKNSPVVLGVKISNDSIGAIVNTLRSLPPEQINQIKNLLCAPPASPSSSPR